MKLINKIEQGIINTPSYLKTNLNKFRDRLGEKGLKRFKNASFAIMMCAVAGTSTVVLAADDPLSVVNNLSNFIFGLIRAVGMIINCTNWIIYKKSRSISKSKWIFNISWWYCYNIC